MDLGSVFSSDAVEAFLAVFLIGLSVILAAIGAFAARRLGDARLSAVSVALAVLAVVGILGLVNAVSPAYGGGFEVDPLPLLLIVLAVALLYFAFVRARPRADRS